MSSREESTSTKTTSTETSTHKDSTSSAGVGKHNPNTEDATPRGSEHEAVKDSDKSASADDEAAGTQSGQEKKNHKEDVNTDGFVPGEPLSKNHPDSTAKARREAKEQHHDKEGSSTTTGGEHNQHEGIGSKLKHAMHHEKKTT